MALSVDEGRHSERAVHALHQVNALASTPLGWTASNPDGLWQFANDLDWSLFPGAPPALVVLTEAQCGQVPRPGQRLGSLDIRDRMASAIRIRQ